jgi:hypothetical protein
MAVAAPARRTAPAPGPSRTAPPGKRKAAPARPAPRTKAAPARAPRTRPKPRAVAAAPARKAPARRAPARKAPARAPRRVGGQLIPLAGRTAVAVSQLPDSGLVVRMTRGRAWIVVLGVLLAGIVALNVLTLSFSASASRVDQQAVVLDKENSRLGARDARLFGTGAMRSAAGGLGLAMPPSDQIHFTDAGADDAAVAAQRLAAAGG